MADAPAPKMRGLGRGLSALIADLGPEGGGEGPPAGDFTLPLSMIRPNPDQPRRAFPEEALRELADSIRGKGVIQPLIVRPDPFEPGLYQIAAGERRWRAAQMAGATHVPVIVRHYDDAELLEVAIIENVQRDGLNPIDEGAAYQSLMERFGHTQEQVATALGKSRSHVANQMRLLGLPVDVQAMVADGRLTAGHARPLIGHPRAADLARRVAERGLSVREVERLSREARAPHGETGRGRPHRGADILEIEAQLAAQGIKARIEHPAGGQSGRLVLSYRSPDELDALLARLGRD